MSGNSNTPSRAVDTANEDRGRLQVAFLTQNSVFPLDNGARIRNWALLDTLRSECDVTVVLTDTPETEGIADLAKEGISVCHVPKRPGVFARCLRELVRPVPLTMAIQRNGQLEHWLRQRRAQFDVVVAGSIARAPHPGASGLPPVVVDTHNVEYMRYGRARRRGAWRARLARTATTIGMKRYERSVLSGRVAVACSTSDAEALRKLGVADVRVVPNGTWIEEPVGVDLASRPPTVVFVGDLTYGPNAEAAEFLACEIAPRVRRQIPHCRFVVAGRGAAEPIRRTLAALGVEVISPLRHVNDVLSQATVEVVPLSQGGGTRLKILEAFAAGVPVVSTTVGAEGIEAVHGQHLLVVDDPARFAQAVVDLHADRALSAGLATSARDLAAERYDWRAIGLQFLRVVQSVAEHPSPSRTGVGGVL